MKNINIKALLSLVICVLITFTSNVFAGNATGSLGNEHTPNIQYYAEGIKTPIGSPYVYRELNMTMNGKTYRAFCVDPGLKFSSQANKYTCTPFNTDAGLNWLLSQYGTKNEVVLSTAIRFYGAVRGYITEKDVREVKAALLRYVQMRFLLPRYPDRLDYQETLNVNGDYTKYFSGDDKHYIDEGYELFENAMSIYFANSNNTTSGTNNTVLKLTYVSTNGNNVTYALNSSQHIPNIDFRCSGANCNIVNKSWNGTSGSITVNVKCAENYTIAAYFAGANSSNVYECSTNQNQDQDVYVYVPNDGSETFAGTPIPCTDGDCCTDDPIEPGKIDGIVNNCCTDNTTSEAHEYELNEIFCKTKTGTIVDRYYPKCNTNSYIDSDTGLNQKYCNMYCTERISVEIPGAITATSGRYFKLNETSHSTKSPYIEGYRRCRIIVDYDNWKKDYETQVNAQVTAYNNYQKHKAYLKIYEDATKENKTEKITISCTASCAKTTLETTMTTYLSYTKYTFNDTSNDYFGVTYSNNNIINAGKLGTATVSYKDNWRADSNTFVYKDSNGNVTSSASTLESDKEKDENKSCDVNWVCSYTSSAESHAANISGTDGELETYAVEDYEIAYKDAASKAKQLENDINLCHNYFKGNNKGAKPEENYDIDTSIEFYYTQVYLNDEGKLALDKQQIDFAETPGCVVEGPYFYGTNIGNAGEISASTGSGTETFRDFKSTSLDYVSNSGGYSTYLDDRYTAQKIYSHDAKYVVKCSWDEHPENKYLTLVPNGSVSEETSEINYTEHNQEYRLYLTTFDGTYETEWVMSGLGSNGKFDEYFMTQGTNTCGGENPVDTSMLTCKLHVEYEIVLTGYCNGTNGTDTTTSIDDCDPYKEGMNLFNFRVVDPSNIFPSGTTQDGKEFAYNWTQTAKGQLAKEEIENLGKKDMTYAPSNITYSFTLTPSDMKHIKNYNQERISSGGYSDFRLKCTCGTSCSKCKSDFIEDLSNGYIKYDSTNHSVTGWSGAKSLIQIRNSVIGG